MGSDYVPSADAQMHNFANGFHANLPAVREALGLPETFAAKMTALVAHFSAALEEHRAVQVQARSATKAKDASKAELELELRNLVRQLRAHPGFTDAQAALLGLPVHDRIRTPSSPPKVAPEIAVSSAGSQRQTIEFWNPDGNAPGRRGKAPGARACRIVYAIVPTGEAPPPLEEMAFLASVTATPFTWQVPGEHVGKDIWYRAAWESPRGDLGPFSDPARGTVSA
jgi:hypothetical protein